MNNEAKIVNTLLLALLVISIVIFSWTCVYFNTSVVTTPTPTTIVAFGG